MTRSGKNSDKKKCDILALAVELAQRRPATKLMARLDALRSGRQKAKLHIKAIKIALKLQAQWAKAGRSCGPPTSDSAPATAPAAAVLQHHLSHSETGPPAEPGVAEAALTQAEVEVLMALAERPGQSMLLVDLVEAGGYSKNTTRACVRRLVEHGMISRSAGRRKGVAITSKGDEFLAKSGRNGSTTTPVTQ